MRILLVVAIVVLASGCLSAQPGAPGPKGPGPMGDAASPSERLVRSAEAGGGPSLVMRHATLPEVLAGEPSTAIGPDGTRYVAAVAGPERANVVWRSIDQGRNWTYLGPVAKEYETNDADLSVAPDGSVWVATFWGRMPSGPEGPWCVAVSRSTDQGASWQTTGKACPVEGFQERPWLVTGTGQAYLLHGCASTAAWCLGRTTGNRAWTTRPLPFPAGGIVSRPVLDAEDDVAIAFSLASPDGDLRYRGLFVARSPDQGVTWSLERVADETVHGRFLQLATDGRREVVAWANEDAGGAMRIRATIRDQGRWQAVQTLNTDGTAALPWATGADGRLGVAWLHSAVAAHPHAVAATQRWTVQFWDNGTVVDLGLPAYEGPLCGASYTLVRACGRPSIGDFFSAANGPDDTTTIAFGNGVDEVQGFNAVRLHVATLVPANP